MAHYTLPHPAQSRPKKYYQISEVVDMEETYTEEFKGHICISAEEIRPYLSAKGAVSR